MIQFEILSEEIKPMQNKTQITKYNISNLGKVIIPESNYILIPQIIKKRLYVILENNGNRRYSRLDYLVAENFLPIPEDPIRLIHIDDDLLNCREDNLMWLTKHDIIQQYIDLYQLDEDVALEETWRELETPIGLIEVSSFGQIRNIHDKQTIPLYKSHGYKVIYYIPKDSNNKETKILNVHRLVAEAFIPNPKNYDIVNHLDGDKSNNHIWNLEWANISMNTEHAFLLDKVDRYTEKQLHSTCKLIVDNKLTHVQISMITGVDRKTISDIVRGRRHSELMSQYKFPAKKWSKELSLRIIDCINEGYKGKEVLNKLNIPTTQSAISFYERTRRQYKDLIRI